MRTTRIALLTVALSFCFLFAAESGAVNLAGRVLDVDGSTVADAPIRLRNEADGIDARTRSDANGDFVLADVSPGVYLLTVHYTCCLYNPYINEAVVVGPDGTTEFDIHMTRFNLDIEGDNVFETTRELLATQVVPDEPVPRMPDGRPDLTGVWLPEDDPYPEDPRLLDWVVPIVEERIANLFIDNPSARCRPGTLPIPGGAGFVGGFVQRPELLVVLLEDVPGFRQIFLDGREHPARPNPTWLGHSIGRWEGDTLVVDTVGFNDRGWTDIYPRTTELHMEERYERIGYGELEVTVTYDDPGVFSAPWSRHMIWKLAPQADVMEYVCENNKWQDTTAADVGTAPR